MPSTEKPILFHYSSSIYSHRVLWYLWLRNIAYDECIQSPVMPRPDLESIGVGYRKIPILSIGKDIYCDSRLIIAKLEARYPNSDLSPSTPAEAGTRKLLENWAVDGGIFANAVKVMPFWIDSGALQNKVFLDDRQKLSNGWRMTKESMEAGRPDGLQHIRQAFEVLETTFFADGRDWILGTKGPSVADIEAVWPFEWMLVDRNMKDCLPKEGFGEERYPKVYAWVKRFMDIVGEKKKGCETPTTLVGEDMTKKTMSATGARDDIGFIEDDPLGFKRGDHVEIYPSDYGQIGKSVGVLVGLSTNEVVIENDKGLYLHFPRWNFSIRKTVSIPSSIVKNPTKIPNLRLIYHPASPFSRKVFMLAHELGLTKSITLQKVVVCPVPFPGWSDNNADVSVYNPMTKIPCLVSEEMPDGIFDSRIICEYLEHLASATRPKDARYWQLHTLHACADGIMDAAVLITYEIRIRKARGLYFEEWIEGQKQKIIRALDRLEVGAKANVLPDPGDGAASADEVAIAVATAMTGQMGYLGIDWKDGRPKLEEWLKKWEARPSFENTPTTKDWDGDTEVKNVSKI